MVSAAPALAPPPGVAEAAAGDARRGIRKVRARNLRFALLIVLILGIPSLLESGHISAEWALAFGRTTAVTATVTGSAPSGELSRTCGKTSINVVWVTSAGFRSGSFTVCSDDASQFPVGRAVQVNVLSGDGSVIQGEGRGSAVFGVVIESLVVLGALLLLAAVIRQVFVLTAAGRRWPQAPWLPGMTMGGAPNSARSVGPAILFVPRAGAVPWTRPPASERRRTALARSVPDEVGYRAGQRGFDPGNAVNLITWRRKDREQLTPGDQGWLVAPRRAHGRRRAPYAVIRDGDHRVFWATGRPLPGDSNW